MTLQYLLLSFIINFIFIFKIERIIFKKNLFFKDLKRNKDKKKENLIQTMNEASDFLDYIILNLESGKSIKDSFFGASASLKNISLKLACEKVQKYSLLGESFSNALKKSFLEHPNSVFHEISESLLLSIQYGSPLAHVLEHLSDRFKIQAASRLEELAGEAPVKMIFPLVFFIFPVIFTILSAGAIEELLSAIN